MPDIWTAPEDRAFRDAYLDWSGHLARRRAALDPPDPDRGHWLEPIFVRLLAPGPAQRQRLLDLIADPQEPLWMDPHEQARLRLQLAETGADGLPDEYALYRRLGTPDARHATLFTLLDSGVALSGGPPAPAPPAPVAPEPLPPGTPIIALIDDGIGFLNARFCRATPEGLRSRFRALWLQSLESHAAAPKEITCGRVLDAPAIDALLAEGHEASAYARLNAALYAPGTRQETGHAATHGTHVLDLAAGADPLDAQNPVRGWPLLAVQLPPEAIDDTAGLRFESYMVQGLRWLLMQAHALDPKAPVIVNLSLGVIAGPKDGSRFVEYQMAREAAQWQRVKGQPVRLVWAFGNTYHGDQVARLRFAAGQPGCEERLTWRVQPDDETASYLEIRTRGGASEALAIALRPPGGSACAPMALAPGQIRTLERNGAALARIHHVPQRDFGTGTCCPAHYLLALAPTRGRKPGEPEAAPGGWEVTLRHEGAQALQAILQVQRDDRQRGSAQRGRQSYLESANGGQWDPEEMAYVGPAAEGPIRPEGSHGADTTVRARHVLCCGAARVSGREEMRRSAANFRPSAYTAMGADWSVPGPSAATVVDTGSLHPGIRGAGTLSGSTRPGRGTSAAAGRMTRALGLSAARITAQADAAGSVLEEIDPDRVPMVTLPAEDHPRLGPVILLPGKR